MQRTTGRCFPILTVITYSVEGDEIIEQGKVASTVFHNHVSFYPYDDRNIFRKNLKIRNTISQPSLSNTVYFIT